jgi:DNA-binding transcriptional ArsR family regulator
MDRNVRPDDPQGLRQFKAEFFKGLAHPLRIRILELLGEGRLSVGQLQDAIGVPASSISQQLAVLRGRNIVVTERRGTTVIYRVRDAELFELLDAARRIFNAHLADTIDMLRLVDAEPAATAKPSIIPARVPGSQALPEPGLRHRA